MLHKILLSIVLSLAVPMVQAEAVKLTPDHPDSYVVVKGDTLWGIAGRFLQEPWRWPEIWKVNPQIENPNLIYPGDVVTLKFENGKPVLAVSRPGGAAANSAGSSTGSRAPVDRDVKLTPKIRVTPRKKAIHSIPINVISHFLSRPLVLNDNEMSDWPYIVAEGGGHLLAGKGDKVYVRGLPADSTSKKYSVYRKGKAYKSHGKVLGYEALHVADAVVLKSGDPAVVRILQANREVMDGDRLYAQSTKYSDADFIPRSPDTKINGSIISAVDAVFEIGRYQIVVIDRGQSDGLKVGNVLGIYSSGKVVEDKVADEKATGLNNTALMKYLGQFKGPKEKVTLPDDLNGVLMVFRTFDKLSYALVMEAYGPIHMHDTVKNL